MINTFLSTRPAISMLLLFAQIPARLGPLMALPTFAARGGWGEAAGAGQARGGFSPPAARRPSAEQFDVIGDTARAELRAMVSVMVASGTGRG